MNGSVFKRHLKRKIWPNMDIKYSPEGLATYLSNICSIHFTTLSKPLWNWIFFVLNHRISQRILLLILITLNCIISSSNSSVTVFWISHKCDFGIYLNLLCICKLFPITTRHVNFLLAFIIDKYLNRTCMFNLISVRLWNFKDGGS